MTKMKKPSPCNARAPPATQPSSVGDTEDLRRSWKL